MKLITVATILALSTGAAFAGGTHGGGHGEMMEIGMAGKKKANMRTIKIELTETDDGEMLFEPRNLQFKKGETVVLAIKNIGENEHEFVMDTVSAVEEHKAVMAKFPEMEHDDPNAIRLQPGESGKIIWTFANAGTFEFACLIPGHYDAGMHGELTVN